MQSVPQDILNERYKIVKQIGNGAYAIVWEAVNIKNQQRVAIKQLVNLRDELTIKRSLREILLLKHFNNHPNIVHIFDVFVKSRKMEEVFVVCELMETDLHSLVQSSKTLHADWYKLYTYQILCGLKCIHSAGVLHRDLKPKNILINKDGELKICDFGMGKAATTTLKMTLLEQVATPYYRAPEGLLLKDQQYTEAVDVWATGCILAELILKRPLFPGKNNQELLDCIVEVLGTPSQEDLDAFPESGYKDYLKSMPKKEKKDFSALFFGVDPLTIELLEKMLVFNYKKRITVEQALEHPYFTELHDEDEEPVADSKFQELEQRLTKQQMHDLINEEVKHYQRIHWEEDADREQQPVQQTAPSEEPALTVDFSALFFGVDPLTIELLEKMLVFNYKKRITVEQALEHPYFTELHDEDEEPVADSKFQELEQRLTKQQMHDLINEEVKHYQRIHWEEDADREQQPVQQTAPSEEPALTVGN